MMKIRCNTTLISALILSLCLVTIIPGALKNASTWKELYFNWPGGKIQNFWMQFGFIYLGIVMIGLIVLWTRYRKRERWAWFVMLIILLCFDFPSSVLPVLLQIRAQNYRWSLLLDLLEPFREPGWWHCLTIKSACCDYVVGIECVAVVMLIGLLRSLVMSVALFLPVKAFFWRSANSKAASE
jgi:cytochrome bd-type quinol oxidase subunit 2